MKTLKIRLIICSILLITSSRALHADDTYELAAEINNLKQNDTYILSRLNVKDAGIKDLLDSVENSKLLAETAENKMLKTFLLKFSSIVGKSLSQKSLVAVDEKQAPKLHAVIQSIADKLKMAKPFIFVVFDKKLFNAAAFSFSKRAAVIFIGEKLLNDMNDEQVEAILAHELGHIYYNHVPKRIALQLFAPVAGIVSAVGMTVFLGKYFNLSADINKLTFFASFISCQVLMQYLMSKYSRMQEREADDIAIKIAGSSEFTGSMEHFKDYYLTKIEEFKKEYEFLLQKIEELEKISPNAAAELKVSANVYKVAIDGIYNGIVETGAGTHPAMNERIEAGKKAQEQAVGVVAA